MTKGYDQSHQTTIKLKIRKMKRKINLFISLTLIVSSSLFGQTFNKQNTYIDALKLKAIFEQNQIGINILNHEIHNDFYTILQKYGINETNIISNIFFNDSIIIKKNDVVLANNGSLKSSFLPYTKPDLEVNSTHSLHWQASIINGFANFMAGRFKQEALHMTIDQIFKQIKTEKNSVLVESIFPKTFNQIERLYGLGSSSYYTADLLLLRQTAQIDIEQIPESVIKNSEVIIPSLKNEPKLKDMLSLTSYIIKYSQQGQSLDQLLSTLANESYSSESSVYKIINTVDLISQALLNKKESEEIWINPITILPTTSISLKNIEIRYFYGLLYQQLIQIPEFKSYLESQNSDGLITIATKIQDLVKFVNKLNNTYKYIESKEFNLKTPEEIIIYVKEINNTLNLFTSNLSKENIINLNDCVIDIPGKYITIVEVLMKKNYQKAIPLLIIEFGAYMNNNAESLRTIIFLSQLATIESAEDMEILINSYALPIGSSSIKRHSSFNISINGYVGLTGGLETAYGSQRNQTNGNIGLSAPIGLSTTFYGYLTSFVSFMDLGSIVNQRLNNDTTSYSNLKFEHFFTPGIGLFVNFPKFPITSGIHFNYTPNLRNIKYESGNTTITESNRSVTRINFSVLVDIPLFTLYNTEKRKYKSE